MMKFQDYINKKIDILYSETINKCYVKDSDITQGQKEYAESMVEGLEFALETYDISIYKNLNQFHRYLNAILENQKAYTKIAPHNESRAILRCLECINLEFKERFNDEFEGK